MMEAWLRASEMTASFSSSKGFKQPTVGVETGGVEDGVAHSEKGSQLRLQVLVHALSATDEANRCGPVAVPVEAVAGCLFESRMVGQTEIVVGTKVDHPFSAGEFDVGSLGRNDGSFGLEEASLGELGQPVLEVFRESHFHGPEPYRSDQVY